MYSRCRTCIYSRYIYEESLRLAQKALSIDSHSPDAHRCAGNAYMSKADYESAFEHYKKLLRMMRITVIDTSTISPEAVIVIASGLVFYKKRGVTARRSTR